MKYLRTNQNIKSEERIRNNRLRRKKQLRKNITLFLLSIIFILTLSIGGFAIGSKAMDKDEVVLYKYYTNIVVQYGEDIEDIAIKFYCEEKYSSYDAYINEVLKINRMYDKDVKPGTYLIVPYYSSEFK